MDPITIALLISSIVASLGGTAASIVSNHRAVKRQEEHDREMALLSQQIEDEQFAKQNIDFNKIANERSQIVEAGYNPALMYGGMSPNVGFQTSSGATAGNVGMKPDYSSFKGLSSSEFADYNLAAKNGESMREQMKAESNLAKQKALESAARTVEQQRSTRFQKSLEKVIYDQQTALLNESQERANKLHAETWQIQQLTPAQMDEIYSRIGVNQSTIEQINKEIETIQLMIEREPLVRNQLRAEARHLNAAAVAALANRDLSVQEKRNLEESLKSAQISRLAREFGLQKRRPNGKVPEELSHAEVAFSAALVNLGFDKDEALAAAYYFSFGTLDDLSSEWINAGSRALAGLGAGFSAVATSRVAGKGGLSSPGAFVPRNKKRMR